MAKKKRKDGLTYSTEEGPVANNPFSTLSGLTDLPEVPIIPADDKEGEDAGAGTRGEEQSGGYAARQKKERANSSVRVRLDRKYRRGKEVTIVEGVPGTPEELERLATLLKTKCGVGGSVKDGLLIIQGNKRDRVIELLLGEGFRDVKKAGG